MSYYPTNYYIEVPLVLVTFSTEPAIVETGSSLALVALKWGFNRDPATVTINGVPANPFGSRLGVPGPFTADTTWSIKGSVDGKLVSGNATLSFQNKAYWGTGTVAPTNSAGILALASNCFVTTKTKASLGYACYDGKFPIYCVPTRIGVPTTIHVSRDVAGARGETEWVKFTDFTTTSFNFTNASGFTENYSVMIFNSLPAKAFFSVRW
jgi:hypothetical protein